MRSGFSYGVDFNNVQTRLQRRTSLDHSGFTDFVRRRKWRRTRRLVQHEEIKVCLRQLGGKS
jgi:hypothetical protein